MKKQTLNAFLTFVAFSVFSTANAQQKGERSGSEKRTPPQEAIYACANSSAGQQCEFSGKRGTESGICFTPKESLPLACKPSRDGDKQKKSN